MSRLKAEVFKKNTVRTSATIFIEEVHSFDNFDSVCGGSGEKPWGAPKVISTSGSLIRQITVHGVLVIIGWGFFLPTGAIIAKFGKHRPDAVWFKIHRVVQPLGLLLALIA